MVEFYKIISESEVVSLYINLTDIQRKTYGKHFPKKGTKLCIIDEAGDKYSATKHGDNQLWNMYNWFSRKNVQPGTFVKISYDSKDFIDNKPVVYIEIQGQPTPSCRTISSQSDNNDSEHTITFEFEKQLENFLKNNLKAIEKGLKIYIDENKNHGQQYVTDAGKIDLLCTDENKDFVVIELKRVKSSDDAVGQVLRYMGWVDQNLNQNKDKKVRGLIITPEIDNKLEYAASMVPNIQVKYYRIKLEFVTKDDLEN